MIALPVDLALLRATFPDRHVVVHDRVWRAACQQSGHTPAGPRRLAAVGLTELTASTPTGLAIQLAALECSLGITPTS